MVHRFLAEESYWVKEISFDLIDNSLSHSVSVGAFLDGADLFRAARDRLFHFRVVRQLPRPAYTPRTGCHEEDAGTFWSSPGPSACDARRSTRAMRITTTSNFGFKELAPPPTHSKSRGRIYIPPKIIVILCAYCLSKNVREHFFIARVSLSLSRRGGTLRPRKHSSRSPHISLGYRRSVELHRDAHLHRYVRPYLTSRGK